MKTTIAIVTSCVAAAALAAGCSATHEADTTDATDAGSARELADLAGAGIHFDYTPLDSAADAVGQADLIVSGTVVDVTEGIRLDNPAAAAAGRSADAYPTFVIAVDEVLAGAPEQVTDGKVYVSVQTNIAHGPDELAALNPQAEIVAVLDDITTWRPQPDTTVTRPSAIPSQAGLYAPYRDGLWLQGADDDDMLGIDVAHSDLAPGWGDVHDLTDFSAAIKQAVASD